MKVLLLTTHLNIGGIGVYTVNLAKYLKQEGVSVTVASSGGSLVDALRAEEIPHVTFDVKTKSEFGLKMWKTLPRLTSFVKKERFDVIHAQTRVTQVLAFLSEKFTAVPFITTCHGFFKYRKRFRRLLPCWGHKAIAISNNVRKHLVNELGVSSDRVELVYNGIELEKYKEQKVGDPDLSERIGLDEKKTVIGTVGRLSSVKGQRYLIDAFKGIRSVRDDVQLLIVGEGPEKDVLEEQVRSLELGSDVFLTPGTDAALVEYFALIDIFCLPSVTEGLGIALMEAMAAGKGCVASNVGGLPELIDDDENGILVEGENSKAISEAVLRLLNDQQLRKRFAAAAREKALKNFSIKDNVTHTIGVYKTVINHEP